MSETAKHTEGPWEAGQHPGNPAFNIVKPIMFGNRMGKLPECEGGHSFIRNEADARLIAAAPCLLNGCNALLGLLQLITSRDDAPEWLVAAMDSHRVAEARDAIAKAEGRGVLAPS